MDIASIILQQLGSNRFIAMTGAKAFGVIADGKGLVFRIPNSKAGINHVEIVLTGDDLYDIVFSKTLNDKSTAVSTFDSVFASELHEIFTSATRLDTHL